MTCVCLKIPDNLVRLILQDRFWFVHILFLRVVQFQFLAQFPVDHLAHPVVSCLILLLCYLDEFAYHVIDSFVSINTLPSSAVLLSFIYSCFEIVIMCSVLLLEEIQFLSKGFPFLAMSKFSRMRFDQFVAWNIHTVVFLPIFVYWLYLFCWCLCCLYCFWWL